MKAKVILIGTIAVMAAITYLETREVQELVTTDVEALTGVEKNPCGNVTFIPNSELREVVCPPAPLNGTHKKCKDNKGSEVCCNPADQTDCKSLFD